MKRSPITFGCENQRLSEIQGFWNPREFLLKGPHTDSLRLTSSELQHWGRSSKGTMNIWRGTELSGIRVRAGLEAFSQTEVLVEPIAPFLSSPPTEPAVKLHV